MPQWPSVPRIGALVLLIVAAAAQSAASQVIGTFLWQLQPFCNVVTITVTQAAGVYTLNGSTTSVAAPAQAWSEPLFSILTERPASG